MKDVTAVAIAAGRVRRGDIAGALTLLTRQACAEGSVRLTSVCVSGHHRQPVVVADGTDRCDGCWSDARDDAVAQAVG